MEAKASFLFRCSPTPNYEDDSHEDSGQRQEAGIEANRTVQFVEVGRGARCGFQLGQGVFAAAAQLGQLGGRLGGLPGQEGVEVVQVTPPEPLVAPAIGDQSLPVPIAGQKIVAA